MYPVNFNKERIRISILDKIDDLFEFVLLCVRSFKSTRSFSSFLEKNLHL